MSHHIRRALLLTMFVAVAAPFPAHASDGGPPPHIRTADGHLRSLIDDAMQSSAIVRSLVARLDTSDVVVFVECERDQNVRSAGRLNFISTASGVRYLLVRLKPRLPRVKGIAVLAHELRHAIEIADTPAIVDEASLAREYERMGVKLHTAHGLAFDTDAAVETGRRTIKELVGAKGAEQRPATARAE